MTEDFGDTIIEGHKYGEPVEEKKDRKLWIIVAVVVVILCCCCIAAVAGGSWLWNNGDQLLEDLGLALLASNFVI